MNALSLPILDLLGPTFPEWERGGDGIRLHTHCLYADGQGVTVDVAPQGDGKWLVTDSASGWDVLREHSASPTVRAAARRAGKFSETAGVDYVGGAWQIDHVASSQLVGAVLLVCNASQAWTNKMLEHGRAGRHDMIEAKLIEDLVDRFGARQVERYPTIGGVNKAYEFSALVGLREGRSALFEVVTPFPASLYASYAKMMDVRAQQDPTRLIEAAIRDEAQWRSEDVALIRSACHSVIDLDKGLPEQLMALAA